MLSDGIMRILGAKDKKKHKKNVEDNRVSISVLRSGNAAGVSGPWMFLAEGKKLESKSLRNLEENHGATPGSKIYMTPNAYMTNDAWEEIVPDLCMAIRKSKVVSEHPDWWVFLCCDGFKSHLLETCLPIFTNHKIYLVKEEGDTSHLCQAYDQMVAKADKLHFHSLLDTVR